MRVYRICHYRNEFENATSEKYEGEEPETLEPEVIEALWKYYHCLGVEAVQNIKGIISWEFRGNWYTSDQISRMMELKAFS